MSNLPTKEVAYVRELARKAAQTANSPEAEAGRRRWRDVNGLRKPDRAPVWCRPVGAWQELLPDKALVCSDPWLRDVERQFRRVLIKEEIGDDSVPEPYFGVRAVVECDPPSAWGLEIKNKKPAEAGGSWAYDPPIKSAADLNRLRMPRLTHNAEATRRELERASDLLGDILPVRRVFTPPIHGMMTSTMGTAAADLRGLEQMMMDAAVEPELLHRLMAHLRDGILDGIRQVEAMGILTPNTDAPMLCSDPIGAQTSGDHCGIANCWSFPNSQEFDQVSPAMWEEFCLNYQKPILERFGLTCYGCCENLTRKVDGVLSIPNLRIFVCSAWTNLDVVLEKVSARYCIMWRQKASEVIFAEDESTLRKQLEAGARKLKGRPYQIVLRELQTLAGHPDRLHVWTRLAKEIAAKYA